MRSVSAYQALFCAAEAAGLRAQQAGLHLVGRCISSSASSWATGVRDEEPAHRASASSGSVGQGADAQPTTSAPARTRRRGVLKRDLKLRVDDQGGPSLLERFGAALTSDHQALAGSDASVLSQRLQDQTGQWQAQGTMAEFIPFLRRHNHSLPNLPGQEILAKVLYFKDDRIHVDAGYHAISEVYRPEVNVTHITTPSASAPLAERLGLSDIRVGDVIKVKVEELYTPYGDMQLAAVQQDVTAELHARWTALAERALKGEPVQGRVLNQCTGGYAVGVAGFVGLLPYAQASSATSQRIGTLESFYIQRMHGPSRTLVLSDARLKQQKREEKHKERAA